MNMLWQEKEVIDSLYHSYLNLHQDICHPNICIIHLPYWQNMLLRTKRKISWRIQSGRSYDLTFPSRYAMRKLGSFKWFFIAYLEHIDAIIDSPPHCLHKTTFPLFLGITISSQGKNNLRCTSFMKDQLRRDISLWGANDISLPLFFDMMSAFWFNLSRHNTMFYSKKKCVSSTTFWFSSLSCSASFPLCRVESLLLRAKQSL